MASKNRPFGTFAAVAAGIGFGNEAVVGSKGAEFDGPSRGTAASVRRRDGDDSWPVVVRPPRSCRAGQPAVARKAQAPKVGETSRMPRPVTRPPRVPMRHYGGEEGQGLVLDDGGGRSPGMTYGFVCACGYKVRCGVSRYGDQLGGLVFYDDEKTSQTWGEEVRRCPGCKGRLDLPGLLP